MVQRSKLMVRRKVHGSVLALTVRNCWNLVKEPQTWTYDLNHKNTKDRIMKISTAERILSKNYFLGSYFSLMKGFCQRSFFVNSSKFKKLFCWKFFYLIFTFINSISIIIIFPILSFKKELLEGKGKLDKRESVNSFLTVSRMNGFLVTLSSTRMDVWPVIHEFSFLVSLYLTFFLSF
jgi:hypothetical protein